MYYSIRRNYSINLFKYYLNKSKSNKSNRCGNGNVYNGGVTILVNATNNGIPVIDTNEGYDGELYNLYIESLDSYGMNAINTNIYGEEVWPDLDGFGFKSEITIQTPDSILINKENHLITNPTDIFGRKINGIIILNDGEQEITTTSKIINYTPLSIGNKTLTITYIDPTRKYNTATTTTTITVITPTLTVDTLTTTTGQTINITARITADNETITTINKGKVTFKVNGKTVKDANGKVIYAKVVNGTVSVDYVIPDSMKAGNYTITATFIASGYDRMESNESLTITA